MWLIFFFIFCCDFLPLFVYFVVYELYTEKCLKFDSFCSVCSLIFFRSKLNSFTWNIEHCAAAQNRDEFATYLLVSCLLSFLDRSLAEIWINYIPTRNQASLNGARFVRKMPCAGLVFGNQCRLFLFGFFVVVLCFGLFGVYSVGLMHDLFYMTSISIVIHCD